MSHGPTAVITALVLVGQIVGSERVAASDDAVVFIGTMTRPHRAFGGSRERS